MRGMEAIKRAIAHSNVGSQAALAGLMDISQPTVSEWVTGDRPVPAERCPAIERATDGAVTCDELRPDVAWTRVRDKAWPWHPAGRPAIDVTRTAEPA